MFLGISSKVQSPKKTLCFDNGTLEVDRRTVFEISRPDQHEFTEKSDGN